MKGLFFFSFLFFVSCDEVVENEQDINRIEIEENISSNLKLYDFSSDIELIPLEYDGDESIISSIKKIRRVGDYFYILNSFPKGDKSFMIFDINGNFILNKRNIYSEKLIKSEVKDFTVSESGELIILDQNNNLLKLNQDLGYESHIELPFAAKDVFLLNDKYFFYTNRTAKNFQADSLMYNILVYNKDKIYNKYEKFTIESYKERVNSRLFGNVSKSKDTVFFNEFLNDTIFSYYDNKIEPEYIIDFGGNGFEEDDFPSAEVTAFSTILTENYNWGIGNIVNSRECLSFNYYERNTPIHLIYDKSNGLPHFFNPLNTLRDENVVPMPRYYSGGFYYGWFQESGLGLIKDFDLYSDNSIMNKVINHIKRNSNPVLVKYKLEF